jgi:uncharacterized protein (TIGR02246 family)
MKPVHAVLLTAALLFASAAALTAEASADDSADHHSSVSGKDGKEAAAIAASFSALEKAFNQSDAEGVEKLCTSDAVMMAPDSPDVVGSEEIRKYHQHLFEALSVELGIKATEIQQIAPDWILARDSVSGAGKLKASGQSVPLNGHGLYAFRKMNGAWKIARFSFSSIDPPPAAGR